MFSTTLIIQRLLITHSKKRLVFVSLLKYTFMPMFMRFLLQRFLGISQHKRYVTAKFDSIDSIMYYLGYCNWKNKWGIITQKYFTWWTYCYNGKIYGIHLYIYIVRLLKLLLLLHDLMFTCFFLTRGDKIKEKKFFFFFECKVVYLNLNTKK